MTKIIYYDGILKCKSEAFAIDAESIPAMVKMIEDNKGIV